MTPSITRLPEGMSIVTSSTAITGRAVVRAPWPQPVSPRDTDRIKTMDDRLFATNPLPVVRPNVMPPADEPFQLTVRDAAWAVLVVAFIGVVMLFAVAAGAIARAFTQSGRSGQSAKNAESKLSARTGALR